MGVTARIDFSQLEKYINQMGIRLATIPNSYKRRMITVAANQVLREVKIRANNQIKGQYWLGKVAGAVFIDQKHLSDLEPYVEINFKGTTNQYFEPRGRNPGVKKNGTRRIAEVAFLNEYGVPKNRNQKPRPFLLDSMEAGIIRAMEELEEIIAEFIVSGIAIA